MWTPTALFVLLVAAASAEYGWKIGSEYRYDITSRTLASLHQTSHQYSGVSIKANLVVQPKNEKELVAWIEHAQYAQVQTPLEKGEEFQLPENELEYRPLKMSKEPMIIKLEQGVIVDLIIGKQVPIWEINIIRSIVSQLQVDTQGKNLISSKLNNLPQNDESFGVFKTMEDTVDGECETLYDITRLPKYTLQRTPQLVPQHQLVGQGEIMDIIKTKNFSNCEQRPGYHFGLTETTEWEPTSNQMGNFLSRSAVSRIVLTGNLKSYTIQSSVTTNRIILSPELYNKQKGEVISRVNLTLSSVSAVSQQMQGPSEAQSVHKLVYDYNRAWVKDHEARQQLQDRKWDSSESSSSSSESLETKRKDHKLSRSSSSSSSSSSESSSISSEEWHQDKPGMDQAPEFPFLPYFVGYMGHSIQSADQLNVIEIVKKQSEKIAEEMKNPNEIPAQSTLDRFAILTDLISTMSLKQLEQVTQDLYVKEETEMKMTPSLRRSAWMVFRDAVSQAGTNPSLMIIKKWIENRQIYGEEAAQIVAPIPENTKTPTDEYMKTFFELVKEPEVQKQVTLNTSAIFAFSNLVRMALVNKESMHQRYPVHTFGPLTPKNDKVVVEVYIPYMAEQLRKAVEQEDSHKIQVYTRALGNMAHPKILRVFEPYLEGQQPMTTFQRTFVIVSLNKLAKTYPRLTRSVLYKTYANTGEHYQVRVAAVYNLMKTNPPASMLQRMAEFTHQDPSIQVRSAVKSAIESAARLTSEVNSELRQNAQSAVDMLVPTVFGIQYSRSNMTDYVLRGLNLGYTQTLEYIGSEDHLLPKSLHYNLKTDVNGYKKTEYRMGSMVSSIQDLKDLLQDMLNLEEQQKHQQYQTKDSVWTTEKIRQLLNMDHQFKEQVEGNMLLQWASAQRFLTFDNHTLENMPKQYDELLRLLKNGQPFNYQKMYNRHTITVGFPTSSGLPFLFSLRTPTYIWANGKLQLQWAKESKTVQAMTDVEMGYTTRRAAKISFVTPFDHMRYIAGHDRNMQIVLPIRANVDFNWETRKVKLEIKPFDETKEYRIVHVSAWPYISRHDILDFEPVSSRKNTKIIHIREPYQLQKEYGSNLKFRIEANSEEKFLDFNMIYEKMQQHDFVSALVYPTVEDTIENNQYDLIFDAPRSPSKSIILAAVYDYSEKSNEPEHDSATNRAYSTSTSSDSQTRRQEFLKKVKSGIKESSSSVIDMSVKFQGRKSAEYVGTVAWASSPVDEQSSLLGYFRQNKYEIHLDASSRIPQVPVDFYESWKQEPKVHVNAQVNFGEQGQSESQITLSGKLERSQERREYLEKESSVKQCKREMIQENKLLSGCRNATFQANLLDKYSFTFKYDNLPTQFKNMTYQVYSVLRHLGYPYHSENPIVHGSQESRKVEVDVQFNPDLTSADVHLSTVSGDVKFHNIRVNKYFRTVTVVHPTVNAVQRWGWSSTRQQDYAYCTIDKTEARTFDNVTYPVDIGNVWHVMFVSNPKYNTDGSYDNLHQVSVLVREDSQRQKEIQIILEHSKHTLFEFRPQSGKVFGTFYVDGQQVQLSAEKIYEYHSKEGQVIAQVVVLPSGEIHFVAPKHEFEFLYARERVQLNLAQVYRNRVGGLCGVFNGERYDFVTPQQYVVRDPEQFTATWALSNEGRIGELKQQAEKYSTYKKSVILTNIVSEQDAGRADSLGRNHVNLKTSAEDYSSSSSSSSASSSSEETIEDCNTQRTMVIERQDKHCFSLLPQTACKTGCQVEKTKTQTAKFVCVNKTQTSSHWAQMVSKGATLNLANKGNAQEIKYEAPVKCSRS